MEKSTLIELIKKYHLGGVCDMVQWDILDKVVTVDFLSPEHGLMGTVTGAVDMPDGTLPIGSTARLLSLIKPLEEEVNVQYRTHGSNLIGFDLSDGHISVYCTAGDPAALKLKDPRGVLSGYRDRGRKMKTEPIIKCQFMLDSDTMDRFVKSKKAIQTDIAAFEDDRFILNYSTNNENRIEIPVKLPFFVFILFGYNADYLYRIFSANIQSDAVVKIADNGMMWIEYRTDAFSATYYLNPLKLV